LVLCVGPRRLTVNPIYSQHTRGGDRGSNNVHKFERYLRHGDMKVATVYGPVILGSLPCSLLKETSDKEGVFLACMNTVVET
jgi:pre-rRNA-processing protein TSR1